MDRLLRLGGGLTSLQQGATPTDTPVPDTGEQVFYCLLLRFWVAIQRIYFKILSSQPEIRLYLPFSNGFESKRTSVSIQINRKMVNTI